MGRTIAAFAAASMLALAPLAADAQAYTYRCVSKDGRKHYGSTIPQQCLGQPVEQLNKQGMVVKRIDASGINTEATKGGKPGTSQARVAETPEQREASRRRNALLATYANEKEIDSARARALKDQERSVKEQETRVEQVKALQEKLNKDMEFFKDKGKPPAKLVEDIRAAEGELAAQQGLLDSKKKETAAINARYDQDKKRYQEAMRSSK